MEENRLVPFDVHTELTNYMPLPRSILSLDLPKSAVLQYAALLDRGTLSRKNHFADETGWVYVYFTIEELSSVLGLSDKVVQKNQRLLEEAGLITRKHIPRDRSVRIHLALPEESIHTAVGGRKGRKHREESTCLPPQKVPTNNIRKQHELNNNYYQHNEEESL